MVSPGAILTQDRIATLHPKFAPIVKRLYQHLLATHEAGRLQFRFEVFEGFRHFGRQVGLVSEGVSKAGPWMSAHNYGLATDFVPYLTKEQARELARPAGWYWPEVSDPAWKILKEQATIAGATCPITWDKPHVEFLGFRDMLKKYLT